MDPGELRNRVTFYKYVANDGPEPGEKKEKVLYKCWAEIDEIWLKDVELAKQNGTLSDLTIIIRDPLNTYVPSNKDYVSINHRLYKNKKYNIKKVQPDAQDRRYINIVAEEKS